MPSRAIRRSLGLAAALCALATPAVTSAQTVVTPPPATPTTPTTPTVPTSPTVPTAPTTPTTPTAPVPTPPTPLPPANSLRARGTVTALSWSSFTIRTGGRSMSVLGALNAAANAVSKADLPYVYGGGHAAAGTASVGIKGPGYNGRRIGYDCSGSVAAVLAGAGLWPAGSPVPADNGVITQLRQEHLIARGVGSGADAVTLYDDPGVHIFMSIGGNFFGTSDGGAGSPLANRGGPTWLDDGAPDATSRTYHPYHLLGSVLNGRTIYGPTLTFDVTRDPALLGQLVVGQHVQVTYDRRANGTLTALAAG